METYGLPESGYRVFLDRFARKDVTRKTISEGDLVLINTDHITEVGKVLRRANGEVSVEIGENGSSKVLTVAVDRVDKPLELSPRDMHRRVATAVAAVERERSRWETEFTWLMDFFTPGGRILASAGVEEKLSAYNCCVIGMPRDDIHGIFESAEDLANILRRGSGVGMNISRLRPRGSSVRTVNGRSSGPIAWSALFSMITGLVQQGGSRIGALMVIMDDWHPDIEEFIHSKRDLKFNTHCNQSIAISDDFMRAVQQDGKWQLSFPDTRHPVYDAEWVGDLRVWKQQYPDAVVDHKVVKARDLWRQITESVHASGEPGLFFKDRVNALSNSYYYPEGMIYASNPCAEEPLPAYGVCNLGHLILPRFVSGPIGQATVDWDLLSKATETAVRFLDDVIDYTGHFDDRTEKQQKSERRVGLGTLGLAELLIRCGIRYGSNKSCLEFIDKLYKFIAEHAYAASSVIATEKASFPKFEADKFLASGFMLSMDPVVRDMVRINGIRNVTLLTQAPCGTVGTVLGTSAGIEPFFDFEWTRRCRVGVLSERAAVVDEYMRQHPSVALPGYFVAANDMTPADHAYTQAAIQRWVDSAVSKTSNVPESHTAEQIGQFYQLLYDLGCKGGTVYRDKSRDQQVLSHNEASAANSESATDIVDLPDVMDARKTRVKTPMGTMHVIVSYDSEHEPRESFATVGKGGSDVKADIEAINRLVSLILKLASPVPPHRRLQIIMETLRGIGGRHQEGFGPAKVLSIPDGFSKAIAKLITGKVEVERKSLTDLCPECGGGRFASTEGCHTCLDCGYSLC